MNQILAIILSLILFPQLGWSLDGNQILKNMEDVLNAPKDRTVTSQMTLIKSDGSSKKRTIKVFQKNKEKRLIVFLKPEDVKGVGFLALSDEQMYLYLPSFRKIRRIASHIKNEDFMGTDFSYEDLATSEYLKNFNAALKQETKEHYLIELTALPESDSSYVKEKIWVDKASFLPLKVELYGADKQLLKEMRIEAFKQIDGYWIATKMKMKTISSGHQTLLEITEIQHDQGLKDKVFTKRNLKRQAR